MRRRRGVHIARVISSCHPSLVVPSALVIPNEVRNRDLTGRGRGLVIGHLNWLLGFGTGYRVPAREPLPSPLCRLPSAICSALPSALSYGPLPVSPRFLAPLG